MPNPLRATAHLPARLTFAAAATLLLVATPALAHSDYKMNHLLVHLNEDTLGKEDNLLWTAFFERSFLADLVRVGVGYSYYGGEVTNKWFRGPEPWKIGRQQAHRFSLAVKLGMYAETGGLVTTYYKMSNSFEYGGLSFRWTVPLSGNGYFSVRSPVYVFGVGYYDRRLNLDAGMVSRYGLTSDEWEKIQRDNSSHRSGMFWIFRLDALEIIARIPGLPIAFLGAVGIEVKPYLGYTASAGISF